MRGKLISSMILLILILTIFSTVSSSFKTNINHPLNENNFIYQTQQIDEKYPVMIKPFIFPDPKYENKKPKAINTPEEFNWANLNGKDWTTPAKHQGPCGSCWDFAVIGVLESIIKIRENAPRLNPDLSEQYVLSCIQGAGSCYGGSSYEAAKLIMAETPQGNNVNGVPFETCFNYFADHTIPCEDKCESWMDTLVPISEHGFWRTDGSASDRDIIKTEIYENGPVVTHIKATDAFKIWGSLNHNPDAYYPYLRKVLGLNHVVIIVGWKDDPSIRHGGYWICKNSWGAEWGYNGFFNIEYNALNIDTMMIVTVDYDPESFNWKPLADAGGSYGAKTSETINFDASDSIGFEAEIVEYKWDFGNEQKSGIIVQHKYTKDGFYHPTLSVTDENNNIVSTTAKVWIQDENQAVNKPSIQGVNSGTIGVQHKYTFTANDPEENDIFFYIDWGDGDVEEWIGPYSSGEEVVIAHSWNKFKEFTIKAKAKDVFNSESEWTTTSISLEKNKEVNKLNFHLFIEKLLTKFPNLLYFLNLMLKIY